MKRRTLKKKINLKKNANSLTIHPTLVFGRLHHDATSVVTLTSNFCFYLCTFGGHESRTADVRGMMTAKSLRCVVNSADYTTTRFGKFATLLYTTHCVVNSTSCLEFHIFFCTTRYDSGLTQKIVFFRGFVYIYTSIRLYIYTPIHLYVYTSTNVSSWK